MSPTGLGTAVGLVSEAKKIFAISQRTLKEFIYLKMGGDKDTGDRRGYAQFAKDIDAEIKNIPQVFRNDRRRLLWRNHYYSPITSFRVSCNPGGNLTI